MRPVPAECTLPTAEQPLRVAEFDDLFAALLIDAERTSPSTVVLGLRGGPAAEAAVHDLTAREAQCCSFFRFTVTRTGPDRLRLEVAVPEAHIAVLDGLVERAAVSSP